MTETLTLFSITQFLIAFGLICGLAGWFLYQKSLARLIEYIKTNQKDIWEALDSPVVNIDPLSSLQNQKLRQFIFQKQYDSTNDIFVSKLGSVIRQKLLFCFFCLIVFIVGVILLFGTKLFS